MPKIDLSYVKNYFLNIRLGGCFYEMSVKSHFIVKDTEKPQSSPNKENEKLKIYFYIFE